MKLNALRDLTREELEQQRVDLNDELFNLKMRRSLKSLDNPLRMRTVKRDIARINTILREDSLGLRKLAETKGSILDAGKAKDK